MEWLIVHYRTAVRAAIVHRNMTVGISTVLFAIAIYLTVGGPIGSEFLPHLDEGSIWVRGTLPPSEGPTASIDFTNKARVVMASFPEVTQVVSQTGRPDDGTDTAGFFNTEYFVDLKRKEEWRPVFHQDKEELIAAIDKELSKFPGVIWNYSQPISDNMEEAVSGVKGELAVKLYGDDLRTLEHTAEEIQAQMAKRAGRWRSRHLPHRRPAQSQLPGRSRGRRPLGHQRRRYSGRDSNRGRRQCRHPGAAGRSALRRDASLSEAVPRYARGHRKYPPARSLRRTRLACAAHHCLDRRWRRSRSIAKAASATSPSSIRCAAATSARPSKRPSRKVEHNVKLPAGYHLEWAGEYESQKRANKRMAVVVPDHGPGHLPHPLHHVPLVQVGDADPGLA